MSSSYGLIIERLRNVKPQKYRIILSLFTQMIGPLFDMFTAAMFILFSARFLSMCNPRRTFYFFWRAGPPGLAFYGSGLAYLPSWLEMVNAGWLISMRSEMFLRTKFIVFQGCPIKQAAFSHGQPTLYNQLLIYPFLLIPECYFA